MQLSLVARGNGWPSVLLGNDNACLRDCQVSVVASQNI
jgi:hypothetical protein